MRPARVPASSRPSAPDPALRPSAPIRRIALALLVGGAALHALPHPADVSPLAALALFGGAAFRSRSAGLALSLAALALAGLARGAVLGDFGAFHPLLPVVASSWLLNVALGFTLRRTPSPARVAAASVAGSVQFFALTNLAVWGQLDTYPHTAAGLAACYGAGLSLLARGLLGDLAYSGALFGALALASRRAPALAPA